MSGDSVKRPRRAILSDLDFKIWFYLELFSETDDWDTVDPNFISAMVETLGPAEATARAITELLVKPVRPTSHDPKQSFIEFAIWVRALRGALLHDGWHRASDLLEMPAQMIGDLIEGERRSFECLFPRGMRDHAIGRPKSTRGVAHNALAASQSRQDLIVLARKVAQLILENDYLASNDPRTQFIGFAELLMAVIDGLNSAGHGREAGRLKWAARIIGDIINGDWRLADKFFFARIRSRHRPLDPTDVRYLNFQLKCSYKDLRCSGFTKDEAVELINDQLKHELIPVTMEWHTLRKGSGNADVLHEIWHPSIRNDEHQFAYLHPFDREAAQVRLQDRIERCFPARRFFKPVRPYPFHGI